VDQSGVWSLAFPYVWPRSALEALDSPVGARFPRRAVYVAVLPGICMTVLILYMLLFVRVHLLRAMHLVLHLLPVLSMVGTLWAVSRLEAVDSLSGVLRLQGLIMLVGLGCVGLLAVHKTFIGIHLFKKHSAS
jgi:hypothetical protein